MTAQEKSKRVLHDLIATSNDAAEGFGKAAKGVHDTDLSNWLAAASEGRLRFAADLSRVLHRMGDEATFDLHEGGILHKGWVDLDQHLRSTAEHLHSKDDAEIIRECIAGDSGSLRHYNHALDQDLPQDVRDSLVEQRTAVQDDLQYLENRLHHARGHSA